ncbi:CaiB/BaiF CoA transferase family protein [Chloroflexota bacterium]
MAANEKQEGALSPYRVLDLTDEKGLLCGKLMGDMGADVIKVERPGGDPARNIGPFYHDEPDPEKSLFWFALNTSKRGITLDIETIDGNELFRNLVETADFVIESFPPGYMDSLGLGYSDLEKINPGIIMVSITPFGQTGPYKDYKAPDIVAWAVSGVMSSFGDPDRPPIRVSHHSQSYYHAASEAAAGASIALYMRGVTGEGQHVDVSIQESTLRCSEGLTASWALRDSIKKRGQSFYGANLKVTRVWECKDGLTKWAYSGGEGGNRRSKPFVDWMDSEGMATDFLKSMDWDQFSLLETTQEIIDLISEPTAIFVKKYTKAEFMEGAVKYRVMSYPIATTADILGNRQLAERGYWKELEHPELGESITYPGAFSKATETPPDVSRRAPLIGEHNKEIYCEELGLSTDELVILKQAEVI